MLVWPRGQRSHLAPTGEYLEEAARKYGIVSRQDLLADGFDSRKIWRQVKKGALEEVRPGAYRIPGTPRSWEQELMGVHVWAGRSSRISHRSAARLLDLDGFPEELLEVTTTRRLRGQKDVIIHRVPALRRHDMTMLGPFMTTTAARTILDLGGVAENDRVEYALEDILRRKLSTLSAIRWELEKEGGRGHPGSKILAELLAPRPKDYVPTASQLEIRIDRVLRFLTLPRYFRQHVVMTRLGHRRPDFAFPEYTVAIEGDSYRHHSGRRAWIYDKQRDRALQALGWDIIYVTWDDLRFRRDEFVRDLYDTLERKGWSPPPKLTQ